MFLVSFECWLAPHWPPGQPKIKGQSTWTDFSLTRDWFSLSAKETMKLSVTQGVSGGGNWWLVRDATHIKSCWMVWTCVRNFCLNKNSTAVIYVHIYLCNVCMYKNFHFCVGVLQQLLDRCLCVWEGICFSPLLGYGSCK